VSWCSPALLGDIYLGKVKTWNDPAIAGLNGKAAQRRHHRGAPLDGPVRHSSGRTISEDQRRGRPRQVRHSCRWPTASAAGNEGVAGNVDQETPIGVEYAYAKQNKRPMALSSTRPATFADRCGVHIGCHHDWLVPELLRDLTDQPGEASC
jgi:phosphate transport system substrate-binding protein